MKNIILLILIVIISGQELNIDHPNPHVKNENSCLYCHKKNKPESINSYIIGACIDCHNETSLKETHTHPLSINISKNENIHIPNYIPVYNDTLNCISCHKPFCETELPNENILRKKITQTDLDFCYECHNTSKYTQINPHIQFDENGLEIQKNCGYCHDEKPNKNEVNILKSKHYSDISLLCTKCHSNKNNHEHVHIGKSILAKVDISEQYSNTLIEYNIPMPLSINNKIQCNTCHYTHQKELLPANQAVFDSHSENDYFLRLPEVNICYACHKL